MYLGVQNFAAMDCLHVLGGELYSVPRLILRCLTFVRICKQFSHSWYLLQVLVHAFPNLLALPKPLVYCRGISGVSIPGNMVCWYLLICSIHLCFQIKMIN